jgi:hypothetical protein
VLFFLQRISYFPQFSALEKRSLSGFVVVVRREFTSVDRERTRKFGHLLICKRRHLRAQMKISKERKKLLVQFSVDTFMLIKISLLSLTPIILLAVVDCLSSEVRPPNAPHQPLVQLVDVTNGLR